MKILLCSILLLLSVCCFFGCDKSAEYNSETFTAQFIIDDTLYCTEDYNLKDKVVEVEPDAISGYIFKGWYMDTDYTIKWNFDTDIITADTIFYGYYVPIPEETFNILYYDEEKLLKSDKVLKNDFAENFVPETKLGYKFSGWYLGETEFDFNTPIIEDIILSAKFEVITYHIKFIADDKIIADIGYSVENLSVIAPTVPEKLYYEGVWNDYELNFTDIEVQANYTPIVYKAEYIIDNEIFDTIEFTVGETVTPPIIPQRLGFTGEWLGSAELGKNTQITAVYTPIVYEVTFVVDGEVLEIIQYTVLNSQITAPAVPQKVGYTGSWQDKDYELENVTIQAEYVPIIYYATFISEGIVIATESFTIGDKNVTVPEVPLQEKSGYIAKWQPFVLELEDITIYSVYELLTFNANFYVDGALLNSVEFTVEDTGIIPPLIPEKEGYASEWQDFEIQPNDITINALYTPITYYVTFVSYNSEIRIPYTVENKVISEPEPTARKHYNVKWQDYEITIGDITVNAIYTPVVNEADFEYKENQDGTLTITKYKGNDNDLLIPAWINDKPVKAIGNMAFNNNENIIALELCYGIEIIEQEAFLQCEKLTTVLLPDSLKKIDKYAFAFSAVTEINIPDSVTEIGEQSFAYTPLKKVKLSDNLSELTNVFYYCSKLESIELGSGLKTIKSGTFNGCSSLKYVYIPKNVTIIEPDAFLQSGIEEIEFEDINNWYICENDEFSTLQAISSDRLYNSIDACRLVIAHSSKYWYHKET